MRRARAVLALATLLVAALVPALSTTLAIEPAEKGPPQLCSDAWRVEGAGWEFCFAREEDRSQGLELNDVRYDEKRVFWKVGAPMSITRYTGGKMAAFKDTLGLASSSRPGFGRGGLPIEPAACPRWLPEGKLVDDGMICLERQDSGPNPAVALWSRWNISNYRFVNGYILRADGSFEPKLLLGGTLIDQQSIGGPTAAASRGVPHFHHGYWRFDFDIDGAANDTVEEFHRVEAVPRPEAPAVTPPGGNPVTAPRFDVCHTGGGVLPFTSNGAVAGGLWCPVPAEGPRVRDYASGTRWRVVDTSSRNAHGTPRSFEILSGSQHPGDGVSSADVWVLQYKGDAKELAYEIPSTPATDAMLALYYTPPEPTFRTDVVVWYAEHVMHEPSDEDNPSLPYHPLGPIIRPRNFLAENPVERT